MKPSDFRKLRLALKLSQGALGKLLGVSGHTILRWEQEQTPIPLMAELAFAHIARGFAAKQ